MVLHTRLQTDTQHVIAWQTWWPWPGADACTAETRFFFWSARLRRQSFRCRVPFKSSSATREWRATPFRSLVCACAPRGGRVDKLTETIQFLTRFQPCRHVSVTLLRPAVASLLPVVKAGGVVTRPVPVKFDCFLVTTASAGRTAVHRSGAADSTPHTLEASTEPRPQLPRCTALEPAAHGWLGVASSVAAMSCGCRFARGEIGTGM